MPIVDLDFMGTGKVSELPADDNLKFNPAFMPERKNKKEDISDYVFNNKQVHSYWRMLIPTAHALEDGLRCYVQRKAAAEGANVSPFAGGNGIVAEDYKRRFQGYEEKYAYVHKQLVMLNDYLCGLGFKFERKPKFYHHSIKNLEWTIRGMEEGDFNKVDVTRVQVIQM